MQLPENLKTVVVEYDDKFLGKITKILAHRQLNKWINNETGQPIKENVNLKITKWWPLPEESAIHLTLLEST